MNWMTKTLYNMIKAARQETFELNGWIMITPKIAKELLKLNKGNYRPKHDGAVTKYSKDMLAGLWKKNGEAIVISGEDGILRNGQHRLNAIIKSGIPVVMYMIFDADNAVLYDMQYKRSCVQMLRALGYSVSNLSPAVARIMLNGKCCSSKYGDMEVCDYVVKNYILMKKVESLVRTKFGKEKTVAIKAPCAAIAYCMLKTGEVSENELVDFFRVVNSNKKCGLRRNVSPALALRKQIDSFSGHGDNLNNRFMEYTYLALRDFHNKVSVDTNFVYSDDGKNAERLIREVQCMDGHCPIAA